MSEQIEADTIATDRVVPPISTDGLAFVLPVHEGDYTVYAIFDDCGQALAVAPTRAIARALIRQNDLEPVDAH